VFYKKKDNYKNLVRQEAVNQIAIPV